MKVISEESRIVDYCISNHGSAREFLEVFDDRSSNGNGKQPTLLLSIPHCNLYSTDSECPYRKAISDENLIRNYKRPIFECVYDASVPENRRVITITHRGTKENPSSMFPDIMQIWSPERLNGVVKSCVESGCSKRKTLHLRDNKSGGYSIFAGHIETCNVLNDMSDLKQRTHLIKCGNLYVLSDSYRKYLDNVENIFGCIG